MIKQEHHDGAAEGPTATVQCHVSSKKWNVAYARAVQCYETYPEPGCYIGVWLVQTYVVINGRKNLLVRTSALVHMYISCTQGHGFQAFPHVSAASNKRWDGKAWVRGYYHVTAVKKRPQ